MTPRDSLDAFVYVTHVYGNNWYVARKRFLNDVWGPLVQRSKKYYIASIKPNGDFIMGHARELVYLCVDSQTLGGLYSIPGQAGSFDKIARAGGEENVKAISIPA